MDLHLQPPEMASKGYVWAATEPATSQGPGDLEGGPVKGNMLVTSRSVSFGEWVFNLNSFLLIYACNTL